MSSGKKRGLGRGLDALLGPGSDEPESGSQDLREIPVEKIAPGKYQPRQEMDPESLEELAASIRVQGVIQPIVVRPTGEDTYELIAGERRWRATQLAGLATIPANVRMVTNESALAMSLIENIQRENLNPMEEALALQRLQDEFRLTHQQIAEAVGKSRATVTNFLRLISLTKEVAHLLENGELEMGHARALLTLTDEQQRRAAKEITVRGLNVRQTEALVRRIVRESAGDRPGANRTVRDRDTQLLEERMAAKLGQPVSVQHTAKGKGRLVIQYGSLDELDGVIEHILGKNTEL